MAMIDPWTSFQFVKALVDWSAAGENSLLLFRDAVEGFPGLQLGSVG